MARATAARSGEDPKSMLEGDRARTLAGWAILAAAGRHREVDDGSWRGVAPTVRGFAAEDRLSGVLFIG